MTAAVLVVAKIPVAGEAKTRVAERVGDEAAADLAAAALLDTLAVVAESGLACVVACTGQLWHASRRRELESALAGATVLPQRGAGFARRLAAAHRDAAAALGGNNGGVLQIGMDTPQLGADLITASAEALRMHDAVLGPATDGGWWALGVNDPDLAEPLADVPMSAPDTARETLAMLRGRAASVGRLPELTDVDTFDDACHVAALPQCGPRFAAAVGRLRVAAR